MKLLDTEGLAHEIRNVIKQAEKELFILSPYYKVDDKLFWHIKEANERGVHITFVYREFNKKHEDLIKGLSNCEVYHCADLHAKIFMNEQRGVLGSMNLHEYSQQNNFELGTIFDKKKHKVFYQDAENEIKRIRDLSYAEQICSRHSLSFAMTQEQRIDKARAFYSQFQDSLCQVSMRIEKNLLSNHTALIFEGKVPKKPNIIISNHYGFLHVKSDNTFEQSWVDNAKEIAVRIDEGNRIYNHRYGFSIYDPKGAGDESYLDPGDAQVIKQIIAMLDND